MLILSLIVSGWPMHESDRSSPHYDPIMDPTISELDLEKLLGTKKKKVVTADSVKPDPGFDAKESIKTPEEVSSPIAATPTSKPMKKTSASGPKLLGRKPLAKEKPDSLVRL